MEKRDEIECALRRLPFLPGAESALRRAVDLLTIVASTGSPCVNPNPFYPASKRATAHELHALHAAALRLMQNPNAANRHGLARLINALHEPGVLALADAGFIERVRLRDMLLSDADAARLRPLLSKLGRAAQTASVSNIPSGPTKGAHKKFLPRDVAKILAHYYRSITGKSPVIIVNPLTNVAGGAFVRLVADVFNAIGIRASAEAMARAAIADTKKNSDESLTR